MWMGLYGQFNGFLRVFAVSRYFLRPSGRHDFLPYGSTRTFALCDFCEPRKFYRIRIIIVRLSNFKDIFMEATPRQMYKVTW